MGNPDQLRTLEVEPEIVSITSLALEVSGSQQVIDRVTVVRGYVQLAVMYPENSTYRHRVRHSLLRLSEALETQGRRDVARQASTVAARSRWGRHSEG